MRQLATLSVTTAMNDQTLKHLIENHLKADLEFLSFTEGVRTEAIKERDRQLFTFSRRLHGLKNLKDPTKGQRVLISEIENFVRRLNELDADVNLFCWKAKAGNRIWGGWCTENEILYSIESRT